MVSYDKQTINTPNPIARYAHRNRLNRVVSIVSSQADVKKVLDYGCGSGAFINAIQGVNGIEAIGYEPFMTERVDTDSTIYKEFASVEAAGPFDVITIFETIEHLEDRELCEFLTKADKLLTLRGKILCSAPIEIGLALLMKEINRCILHKRLPENSAFELFLASFLGLQQSVRRTLKAVIRDLISGGQSVSWKVNSDRLL